MTSINIDPSKLSDEELEALRDAVGSDVRRAREVFEEIDALYKKLLCEKANRLNRWITE